MMSEKVAIWIHQFFKLTNNYLLEYIKKISYSYLLRFSEYKMLKHLV